MERPTLPAYGGTHSYRTGCHHGYVATTGSSAIGLVVVGAVFVVYSLASVILAITVFRHWVSTRYEETKDRKVGFQAISGSASAYRTYIGIFGAIFLIFGVAALANG
jgi:hypothetical protein